MRVRRLIYLAITTSLLLVGVFILTRRWQASRGAHFGKIYWMPEFHDANRDGMQDEDWKVDVGSLAAPLPTSEIPTSIPDRILVMGRLDTEDTAWVSSHLGDWQHAIYTVDDPNAALHTRMNKGKEANPYLTFIIDHYDSLPSIILFLHSHRHGWHVDAPNKDNVLAVRKLNQEYVKRNGYANLRCGHKPGCPDEIQVFRHPASLEDNERMAATERAMPKAWRELFGNDDVPEVIAAGCCAQFAVSREQVLKRPLSDYQGFLRWVESTELDDETSGRVLEYLWHIIFGRKPVHCPPLEECYTTVYGNQ